MLKLDKVVYFLLYAVIAIVFVSYVPFVYGSSLYDRCRIAVLGVMSLLSVLAIFKGAFFRDGLIRKLFVAFLIIAYEFLVFEAFELRYNLDDARQLLIVLLCIIIGYSLRIEDKQIQNLCVFYSLLAVVLGLWVLIFYTGGVSFVGDRNSIDGKNQVGGIVATGAALSLYNYLSSDCKKKFFLLLTIVLFFLSAIIRCRSAFSAFLFLSFFLLMKKYPVQKMIPVGLLLIALYLIFKTQVDGFFVDSLMGSRGVESIDDISTGRADRNRMGWAYLSNHFFEGELVQSANIPWIHNYLLLRLVRYGIWSLFFVFFYFVIAARMVREYMNIRTGRFEYRRIGFYVIAIPYFVSLLEPSYPFGPGTVQVFSYILLGYSLRGSNHFIGDKNNI